MIASLGWWFVCFDAPSPSVCESAAQQLKNCLIQLKLMSLVIALCVNNSHFVIGDKTWSQVVTLVSIRDCTVNLTGDNSVTGEISKLHRCHRWRVVKLVTPRLPQYRLQIWSWWYSFKRAHHEDHNNGFKHAVRLEDSLVEICRGWIRGICSVPR